jgi:hypothetical protein
MSIYGYDRKNKKNMTFCCYFTTIKRFSNQIFAIVKGSRWGGRARTTPAPEILF